MIYAADLQILGPLDTTVRGAQLALDRLWAITNVETRAYTGNIIALTVKKHRERVQEALVGLEGRYAGRQIIGVMDSSKEVRVQVSLVPQKDGLYIERILLQADPHQLQGAILPLLRPATVNHVWWAADSKPEGVLLSELADVADQVIADSLTLNIPPAKHYALADLGWSRCASWREALAQVFDNPDAARQLGFIDKLLVRYSGNKDLPARLFAGFVADTLGWKNLDNVEFKSSRCGRESGDLCGTELSGEGVRFSLNAGTGDSVQLESMWGGLPYYGEINVPQMTLAEGLARVMARPERGEVFEYAWKLAKSSLS